MNKYLKTYIRNRDISIEKNQRTKEYELDYINKNNLDDDGIAYLLNKSNEPQKVINTLDYKGKEYISSLDSDSIINLIITSNEPQKVINILGSKGNEFFYNLKYSGIDYLLSDSIKPHKIIDILLNDQTFISNINDLDNESILYLLRLSTEPQKIIDILDNNGDEFFSNLNNYDAEILLVHSTAQQKVKELLKNFRPDLL